MDKINKIPNRLADEKSPYLLQHAYNPVDWYPWGEEAFEKAIKEDKPIFLSIGYSTCHWCHVMERESFEKEEVARVLKESFVAVKVDREERPDIDAVYMSVCQMLTGAGGWPLTILMTPWQKPFFAGTYLPFHSSYGRKGIVELLKEASGQWKENRDQVIHSGEEIFHYLQKQTVGDKKAVALDRALCGLAKEQFLQSFDTVNGGFGTEPKFPTPHNLLFLLRHGVLEKDKYAIQMADKTLTQMYRGGIYDHIGGGFSRYSTDEKWLVPHFEKMLYDNALLIYAYALGFEITKDPLYEKVVRETIRYIKRELKSDEGGFYCGQDADSEGEEGKYYVFTPEEIAKVVSKEKAKQICERFDITNTGNFEGKNILNLLKNPKYREEKMIADDDKGKEALYQYRLGRTKLHKDDKVLTSWNALMIAALSKAYYVWEDPEFLTLAIQGQQFIENHLVHSKNRLFIRWREEAAHEGQLDDYAFYAWSLLELYQSSLELMYLCRAAEIAEIMKDLFWDEQDGGFYLCGKDAKQLIIRPKESYDGAIPSGNAVAALVLVRLAALTADEKWIGLRDRQLSYLAKEITDYPMAHSFAVIAMQEVLYPVTEIVGISKEDKDRRKWLEYTRQYGAVNCNLLIKTAANEQELSRISPFTKSYPIPENGMAYYVCENGVCSSPIQIND